MSDKRPEHFPLEIDAETARVEGPKTEEIRGRSFAGASFAADIHEQTEDKMGLDDPTQVAGERATDAPPVDDQTPGAQRGRTTGGA